MALFKEINDYIEELLCGSGNTRRHKKEKAENARIENAIIEKQARIQRQRVEKLEKETRKKEWHNIKDQIYSRYQLPIADDAKNIAKDLFGESVDTVSVFFVTDERVVMQRYIEGGDRAIGEYAKNLIRYAFIGGPITATLLRRLKSLEDAKRDGKVIDTEIDIDGFAPFARMVYAVDEIELDGQIIPARRKFSIRCEMTATITEGFRTGPFVIYDDLYLSTKEEMEQITDEDVKNILSKTLSEKENTDDSAGRRYGKKYQIEVCDHGTDKKLFCSQCQGDIIVSPSKKVIGICLDISGSMYGNKLSCSKTAIMKVLENIPTNSNIDVVLTVFSSDITTGYEDIIPFGKKYTESIRYMAIKRIGGIMAEGGTPLYDTINYFLDGIWSEVESNFWLDENRIYCPYTYLIIVSDGEENGSKLEKLVYNGKIGNDAFFAKVKAYRDAGLITEIIPFAYGDSGTNIRLKKELQNISGKKLINEVNLENIIESLVGNVDSILYGTDNLKMMGMSINKKNKN